MFIVNTVVEAGLGLKGKYVMSHKMDWDVR